MKILDWKSWPRDVNHVNLGACSGQARMNSSFVTTVRFPLPKMSLLWILIHYAEFGLYVDRHGDPSRSIQTIEWEGTAEHVAWHPPYILLFDSRFIEVRHIETGRLAQIIPGNDMRCIWDGRGTTSLPPASPGPDGWNETISQEPRVHGVMNANETSNQTLAASRAQIARPVVQHVFELIPTIPLYLPGSLSSPSHSTYFNQSNSPPHSPTLNPLGWR